MEGDEVRGTIDELRELLADDDPHWEVFGLNIPAHPNAPEAVASATLTFLGGGRAALSWLPAVRATYYRHFLKVLGMDDEITRDQGPRTGAVAISGICLGKVVSDRVLCCASEFGRLILRRFHDRPFP